MNRFLISSAIITSVFQDTFLQRSIFGSLLGTPSYIFIFLFFLFNKFKISKILIFIFLYFTLFNILMIFLMQKNINLINGGKLSIIYLFTIYIVMVFSNRSFKFDYRSINIAFILCIIGLFSHFLFGNIQFFHNSIIVNEISDLRPRGFSLESSTLGITLLVLGMLKLANVISIKERIFSYIFLFLILVLSDSKPIGFIFLASIIFVYINRINLLVIFIINFLMLQFINISIIFTDFLPSFYHDLENSTSISTRLAFALSSIITFLDYPFGVGVFSYHLILESNLTKSMDILSNLYNFNWLEVLSYSREFQLNGVVGGLSSKSFFLENLVSFGLPFLIFWLYLNWALYIRISCKKDLRVLLLCLFLATTFYISAVNLVIVFIAYGYLCNVAFTPRSLLSRNIKL